MTSPMTPALMPVVGPICAQASSNGLPKNHNSLFLGSEDGLSRTLAHHVDNVDGAVDLVGQTRIRTGVRRLNCSRC